MPAETDFSGGTPQLLTGWGRTAPSRATVYSPEDLELVKLLFEQAPSRGLIARGMGRSYGDPAQNSGGLVIDLRSLAKLIHFEGQRGIVTAEAGLSLDALMRLCIPLGWFPAVSPGTRFVSVGGSIAADIHGKNHHKDGSFCDYVDSLTLVAPIGSFEVSPEEDPGNFWATAGGMGLTGVVTRATLRLQPIETSKIRVDTERAANLDDAMARMESGDRDYQYSVAWIDCLAQGSSLGRSVLTRGNHARLDELPESKRADALGFAPVSRLKAPPWVPSLLLRPFNMRVFNEFWFRKSPRLKRGQLVSLERFFHPLDWIQGWNRLYGVRGFIQYQFVVPFGSEVVVRKVLERLSSSHFGSFLAVLKRFGPANEGLLSFPIPGWTLALDIPVGDPSLGLQLDTIDEMVAEAGGRVYLAKDARMKPDVIEAMYPRINEWREVREHLDPQRLIQSDLARRLELLP